jgi:hypothetical protein
MNAWLTSEFVSGWHICIEVDLLQLSDVLSSQINKSMVVQLYYSFCALFNKLFYSKQPSTLYIM